MNNKVISIDDNNDHLSVANSISETNGEISVNKTKEKKRSGLRLGYHYIVLKSLKESDKNDVIKCIYIKSLFDFGICVIKEGVSGASIDKNGRDIRDRLMWQKELHEKLHGHVKLPKALAWFEENNISYLVLERIKGKSLHKVLSEMTPSFIPVAYGNKKSPKIVGYLLQIISILEKLHEQHIVHRDVTVNNFMVTPGGNVYVIDMELSYSTRDHHPAPPFKLGTYGYMSPEQEATLEPTTKEDIFSLGAIFIQLFTSISPAKFTVNENDNLRDKLNYFIPDKKISTLLLKCIHPNPEERPDLRVIKSEFEAYQKDTKTGRSREKVHVPRYEKKEILDLIQSGIDTFSTPIFCDQGRGWFTENIRNPSKADKTKLNKGWYSSFNCGDTGILYLLTKAHQKGLDINKNTENIELALDRINNKYIQRLDATHPGLHFGSDGVAAVLSLFSGSGYVPKQYSYNNWIDKLVTKMGTEPDILYGVAGQGLANIIINNVQPNQQVRNNLHKYADYLINKQEKNGAWIRSVIENKKRITRGFAQGVSGIAYFLLEHGKIFNDQRSLNAGTKALQWLIQNSIQENGIISWYSSNKQKLPPWWSDGTPGIALAFLKGYAITNDASYKKVIDKCLKIHPIKVVSNNLSQNQGLAGLGEVYLEAAKITSDEQWIERADWIAQTILRLRKEDQKNGNYWLVQSERFPTASFMSGNSGVLHFLLRYCYPKELSAPLMM
ncbi:Serine/threonine protein kinase [Chitinophaga sp. YR627]|uniref:protein kinase/lanthionine synthetase C family protein n=1 Tax=Chitinophaga sp. YR627 TaxID=1881041 RepID=UPI0008EAB704|nr:protein kinase/lanthionine synthetase C family protein [Chitinophaga sp. YR627]SFN88537.1 Serine/threonine protein kinase [Chitinophaga sp. YR627]